MLNLAVIGTNWVSDRFVEAAIQSNKFRLKAIYSRNINRAISFSQEYQAKDCLFYNDLNELALDKTIDAVYIASPNSLHCDQAMIMMKNGKHVICEKPISSNISETKKMYNCAKQYNVILFEAFKTDFLPYFEKLKMNLSNIGRLRSVYLSYSQYSSRYQKYLDGENPNTFNPHYSNGSIMDIGFYSISAAVSLFGKPDSVNACAKLIDSGVDAHGTVLLNYPDFLVTVQHSKVSNGIIPSEFQGEDGLILIENFTESNKFELHLGATSPQSVIVEQEENSMVYEALAFAAQIHDKKMNQTHVQRTLIVSELITEVRRQTGVVFPADY